MERSDSIRGVRGGLGGGSPPVYPFPRSLNANIYTDSTRRNRSSGEHCKLCVSEIHWNIFYVCAPKSVHTGTEIHTFKGNYVYIRAVVDRSGVGDGSTYDSSYGHISQISLSN